MGRYVVNAGGELFVGGLYGLYAGIEDGPLGANFHVSSSVGNRISQLQFAQLDQALRSGDNARALAALTRDPVNAFWQRARLKLAKHYPNEAPLVVFIRAWVQTV